MTDKITVPRETWDAMREALEEYLNKDNVELQLNGIKSKAIEALTAANAVSAEQFCYCNPDVSLQMVSGGGAPDGYLGRVTLRIGDQYRDYHSHPQATEPAGYKLVPVEPTREMLVALVCTGLRNTFYEEGRARFMEEMAQGYGAMLAAAPEAKQ